MKTIILIATLLASCGYPYGSTTSRYNKSGSVNQNLKDSYCFIGCLKQLETDQAFEHCSYVCHGEKNEN